MNTFTLTYLHYWYVYPITAQLRKQPISKEVNELGISAFAFASKQKETGRSFSSSSSMVDRTALRVPPSQDGQQQRQFAVFLSRVFASNIKVAVPCYLRYGGYVPAKVGRSVVRLLRIRLVVGVKLLHQLVRISRSLNLSRLTLSKGRWKGVREIRYKSSAFQLETGTGRRRLMQHAILLDISAGCPIERRNPTN